MRDYPRAGHPGGTWCSTVYLLERRGGDLLLAQVELLRNVAGDVKRRHLFRIHDWGVLPDYLRCVIELPTQDTDFATRWRLITSGFSLDLPKTEPRSPVRLRRGERNIWRRRCWEYLIRDDADYRAHMDYVHINPVWHRLVKRVVDWARSTFHRWPNKEYILPNGADRQCQTPCPTMIDRPASPG